MCIYCGSPAKTVDHIPPISLRWGMMEGKYKVMQVDACKECNSILHNRPLMTLRTRKNFIRRRLAQLYKKYLDMNWSQEELNAMNGSLRLYVEESIEVARVARKRIEFAAAPLQDDTVVYAGESDLEAKQRVFDRSNREKSLISLREIYHQNGMEWSDDEAWQRIAFPWLWLGRAGSEG